jgi:hypothetical protein
VREPEAAFACAVTPERVNRQEPAPQSVPSIADAHIGSMTALCSRLMRIGDAHRGTGATQKTTA